MNFYSYWELFTSLNVLIDFEKAAIELVTHNDMTRPRNSRPDHPQLVKNKNAG